MLLCLYIMKTVAKFIFVELVDLLTFLTCDNIKNHSMLSLSLSLNTEIHLTLFFDFNGSSVVDTNYFSWKNRSNCSGIDISSCSWRCTLLWFPYHVILTTYKFRNEFFVVYQKAVLCTVMVLIHMEHWEGTYYRVLAKVGLLLLFNWIRNFL